jgi:RNA polymerase sigma factor (sigma-70 family)
LAAVPSLGRASRVEGDRAPEADATRELYERYANQIFRYCQHQLGSREEAEDAVQSTFLNAFRGLRRGVVPELESAWLFKIAHNVCLSRRRSSWRRGRIESPADFRVVEELSPAPSRRGDELIGLQDVLEQMPENQRRAILLREWQGLSYREIAEELELSQPAVETLIFRARRSLAQGLEQPPLPLRKRVRGGADLGNVIAGIKSLLLGGSAAAKVAATVAVVSAGTVAATAPVERHLRQHEHHPVPPPAATTASTAKKTATTPAPRPTAPAPASQPAVSSPAPAAAAHRPAPKTRRHASVHRALGPHASFGESISSSDATSPAGPVDRQSQPAAAEPTAKDPPTRISWSAASGSENPQVPVDSGRHDTQSQQHDTTVQQQGRPYAGSPGTAKRLQPVAPTDRTQTQATTDRIRRRMSADRTHGRAPTVSQTQTQTQTQGQNQSQQSESPSSGWARRHDGWSRHRIVTDPSQQVTHRRQTPTTSPATSATPPVTVTTPTDQISPPSGSSGDSGGSGSWSGLWSGHGDRGN